jgi:nucleotide-binding universal stress UspA family protein
VREKGVDMLVMGWRGPTWTHGFSLGTTLDPVIERSPCSLVVLKACENRKFQRVLVPLVGGPDGALALEVGSILAEKDSGEVTALHVSDGRAEFDLDAFVERQADKLAVPPHRVDTKLTSSRDLAGAILQEAQDYDLVVMGWTREPLMYRVARRSLPLAIAKRRSQPLAVVRASAGIRSWVKRYL